MKWKITNDDLESFGGVFVKSPILDQIGTVFIPVSNITQARDWYCDILGLPTDGEIQFGHLYVIPMDGTGIVLDSKIYSKENVLKVPAFHFNTNDIEQAFSYMESKKVNLTTEIQHNHFFNFKDPDGNHLMICKC
ncbi:catechol 2,3-dioxygenase-like lactoylglutathione lyase family enzyme [Alkalibacillus filiformis]|uniref:Catechol 2,3-dioxygenase-like lactoylglutathione lyase family enzyme n=1 Tax=Alkalibacillus filiformis TaxID=200990 RepID=A0ABU0DTV6_9BACI|nr:VOC family protein [Alkalibacillus filiformis]MDQ0351885.1 catechol 2,3-dioxygenase-like lactoylglutathione lyase family enzyme [Alkalibacillus filiformis]